MKEQNIIVSQVISIIVMLILASVLMYYGYKWHHNVDEALKRDCKVCSYFDKECPYTDEELLEEEYGGGPCGDMGPYEMMWKISAGVPMLGIGLIVMVIAVIYSMFKKTHEERSS